MSARVRRAMVTLASLCSGDARLKAGIGKLRAHSRREQILQLVIVDYVEAKSALSPKEQGSVHFYISSQVTHCEIMLAHTCWT